MDRLKGLSMHLNFFGTPASRLRVLMSVGLILLLGVIFWAMQPATGVTIKVLDWRPSGLHPALLICVAVGFGAYVVSVWIWALKTREPATRLFAASGVLTLLFTFASTRSFMTLPPPEGIMAMLATVNVLGASGFGIVMICLFLIYPSRLPLWRWGIIGCVSVFGVWTLVRCFGPLKNLASVQPITLAEMLGIVLIGIRQIVFARTDPRQRAIALWVGVSVFLGAGAFITTVSLPITFGLQPFIEPQYAFASFLLIYAGLAVGLVRYRLFELGGWAFQLIFHAGVALAILVFDGLLISILSLTPGIAFGWTLFIAAFLYLPLREFAWRRLTKSRAADEAEIFRSVIETALKPSGPQRAQSWESLLQNLYRPLERVTEMSSAKAPRIEAEGLALRFPAVADASAIVLRYPRDGGALFTPRDLAVAEQIVALMRHAEGSRASYDRGVAEERLRIARDIHDNIGAQLLRALHSGAAERKDDMIRDTLADLRDVINNAQSTELPLGIILADMRAETADRLSPHGVDLIWQVEARSGRPLKPAWVHALRSLVREATSNTIKHARASRMSVTIAVDATGLSIRVEDNGRGFIVDAVSLGHGLDNMKSRAEGLGGSFSLSTEGAVTRISAHIPFDESSVNR